MTEQEVIDLFEQHGDEEYIRDERIKPDRRLHRRPDINAFLLLDRLAGDSSTDRDMVCAAEHDEFYLAVGPDNIAAKATEEDIIDLIRCGVRYDSSHCGFAMFA